MNQVLRHILASYKLYLKLVLAYNKLVIQTTQQHFEQTLIIIHAILSAAVPSDVFKLRVINNPVGRFLER